MTHLDDFTLNEYLDGALDESARAAVETHLRACTLCRAKLDELQSLFAELSDLPETRLEHDLTPAILAQLPRKETLRAKAWTPAFAAQLGIVVGTLIWLGMQVVPFVKVRHFAFPKSSAFDLQTLFVRLLSIRFEFPGMQLPALSGQLPKFSFQLPNLNPSTLLRTGLQPSTTLIVALVLSVLFLWIVGNVVLLRSSQEAKS